MYTYPVFLQYADTIQQIGDEIDGDIADDVTDDDSQVDAAKKAQGHIGRYQQQVEQVFKQALWDVGKNSLEQYAKQAGPITDPDKLIQAVIDDQYRKKYYGATLNARLVLLKLQLRSVARRTAAIDKNALGGIFGQPVPFGAQTNITKRLLQGSAIKMEHDIAKAVAAQANIPLIKWQLNKNHKQTCDCDALSKAVDKQVLFQMVKLGVPQKPNGVYFADQVPDPPHPNCRCELILLGSPQDDKPNRLRELVRKVLR